MPQVCRPKCWYSWFNFPGTSPNWKFILLQSFHWSVKTVICISVLSILLHRSQANVNNEKTCCLGHKGELCKYLFFYLKYFLIFSLNSFHYLFFRWSLLFPTVILGFFVVVVAVAFLVSF